jgi:rubrerythrin
MGEGIMVGAIQTWDILLHPAATVHGFGWRVFWGALLGGRNETFLAMVRKNGGFEPEGSAMPEAIRRCIDLERLAQRIYRGLAETFAANRLAARFFTDLAEQEHDHVDLLTLCWAASRRDGWRAEEFTPWLRHLPSLEEKVRTIESGMASIGELDGVFPLVLDIETSEINAVFQAVLTASESAFVRRLKPFREAIETHVSYIVSRLSELAPALMSATAGSWAKLPQMG